jgi:multidrug efflux system membrane fusion protein
MRTDNGSIFFQRALLAGALLVNGCSESDPPAAPATAPATVPVVAVAAVKKTLPLRLREIGNVEAYTTVGIKSRVDGPIVAVGFKDGDDVVKDQMLFEIDPHPLQTQLRQAQAALQRDEAQLANARIQTRRNEELLKKNFISKDAYDQIKTSEDVYIATVAVDQAAIHSAQLQLEHCTIRAPITGRAGRILLPEGNLVKANDTISLVIINQVSPIYVSFSVPEQNLAEIRSHMGTDPLPVVATTRDSGEPLGTGQLTFVDNTVDAATGTIRLKATFQNEDRKLWPGEFVTALLTLKEQSDVVAVPSQAIQTGPQGSYVFIVKTDMTAELRNVVLGGEDDGETIVAKGLSAGDNVVTEGQLRIVPGAKMSLRANTGTP